MKTLFTVILIFIVSGSQINAQSLYPVLLKAHKQVNQYRYDGWDFNERMNVPEKLHKSNKMDLKIISDALQAAGYKYDRQNDTILIAMSYEDHLVGVGPYYLFAKSSKDTKQMSRHFLEGLDFEYKEEEEYTGGYHEAYYSLMYSGKVDSLRNSFSDNGDSYSGTYARALRIIIKDGKIVYPSLLWQY